mmetsp:Transcript_5740/g.14704  ORF Transcript_5740/g.14704 Transcript_5740/m.14704 type:complete len:121 (+) Transcript_5740:348-710(+)
MVEYEKLQIFVRPLPDTPKPSHEISSSVPPVPMAKVCAVCLENLSGTPRGLRTLGCQHTFHSSCITSWIGGVGRHGALPHARAAVEHWIRDGPLHSSRAHPHVSDCWWCQIRVINRERVR